MWKIVEQTGVEKKEAKKAMKDILKLEMKMALVSNQLSQVKDT